MILNVVDMELIIIMRNNFMYPKNKDEFFNYIREIDKNDFYKERILSKSYLLHRNIEDFYKDITDEKLDTLLKSIL